MAVEHAARSVAKHATGPVVVVEKSTVPTGTATRLRRTLARERPDLASQLEVVSNPEFLREGKALKDALEPNRILVGAESESAFEVMRRLYAPLVEQGYEIIETDIATSELSKHASNAFLAMKISFANALARLCERAGADVDSVTKVMGKDPRIGPAFLQAGLGYGGFCFPKDLDAFERLASKLGYAFPLLREVARINDEAVDVAVEKIREALWNLEDKRIALLGLAFKPGTDDVRFAPALTLARRLAANGASVVGYDPEAAAEAQSEVPRARDRGGRLRRRLGSPLRRAVHRVGGVRRARPPQAQGRDDLPGGDRRAQLLRPRDAAGRGLLLLPDGTPAHRLAALRSSGTGVVPARRDVPPRSELSALSPPGSLAALSRQAMRCCQLRNRDSRPVRGAQAAFLLAFLYGSRTIVQRVRGLSSSSVLRGSPQRILHRHAERAAKNIPVPSTAPAVLRRTSSVAGERPVRASSW